MRKIILCAVLGFVSLSVVAQNKSGKITYKIANIDFKDDGTNADGTTMLAMASIQLYELKFNKKYSSFNMIEQMHDESFSEFHNALAKIYISNYDYYFDFLNNQLLELNSDGALLEQKLTKFEWVITSETKMIDQYECYKANYTFEYLARDRKIKKRVITAWFAPSLPYPYGPKNFHGLPGLILELTESTITFLVSKIEISDKHIEIKIPSGKRIAKEQFEKAILKK